MRAIPVGRSSRVVLPFVSVYATFHEEERPSSASALSSFLAEHTYIPFLFPVAEATKSSLKKRSSSTISLSLVVGGTRPCVPNFIHFIHTYLQLVCIYHVHVPRGELRELPDTVTVTMMWRSPAIVFGRYVCLCPASRS